MAGVALGDIHLRFAWQAWQLAASTFVLSHTIFVAHNFVTHHLSYTIFDTPSLTPSFKPLCHTPSFTHRHRPSFTHHLSHTPLFLTPSFTAPSITHHFVTHHLSHTVTDHLSHTIFHNTIFHTPTLSHTIFHTQLCHTPPFIHHLSHITLSHTIFHTPFFTHHFVTHHL